MSRLLGGDLDHRHDHVVFPTLGTFDQVCQLGTLPVPTQTRIIVMLSPSTEGFALGLGALVPGLCRVLTDQ